MNNDLLANPITGDPAHPEKYPARYKLIKCAQCHECWFDRRFGCCFSGGPYDEQFQSIPLLNVRFFDRSPND